MRLLMLLILLTFAACQQEPPAVVEPVYQGVVVDAKTMQPVGEATDSTVELATKPQVDDLTEKFKSLERRVKKMEHRHEWADH